MKTFLRITKNQEKIVDSVRWQDRYKAMLLEITHLSCLADEGEMIGIRDDLEELARKIRHFESDTAGMVD